MYENKSTPIISRAKFRKRLLNHCLAALGLILISVAIGIVGHMYFDAMPFTKALVASTTLMSGLGLSIFPESVEGQLFASFYGILCGYIYIATSSIMVAPILHRMLHKFHIEEL